VSKIMRQLEAEAREHRASRPFAEALKGNLKETPEVKGPAAPEFLLRRAGNPGDRITVAFEGGPLDGKSFETDGGIATITVPDYDQCAQCVYMLLGYDVARDVWVFA
jgi:hypothetical protein